MSAHKNAQNIVFWSFKKKCRVHNKLTYCLHLTSCKSCCHIVLFFQFVHFTWNAFLGRSADVTWFILYHVHAHMFCCLNTSRRKRVLHLYLYTDHSDVYIFLYRLKQCFRKEFEMEKLVIPDNSFLKSCLCESTGFHTPVYFPALNNLCPKNFLE